MTRPSALPTKVGKIKKSERKGLKRVKKGDLSEIVTSKETKKTFCLRSVTLGEKNTKRRN